MNDSGDSRITILLCTANLGNAQPDPTSWDNLVPQDGRCDELEDSPYPLRRTMTSSSCDGDFLQGKQFDLIVFGLQEATFDSDDEQKYAPSEVSTSIHEESSPEFQIRTTTERTGESSDHGFKAKLKGSASMGKAVIQHTRSKLESLTINRDMLSTRKLKESYSSKILKSLILNRLPSYERIV